MIELHLTIYMVKADFNLDTHYEKEYIYFKIVFLFTFKISVQ